MAELSGFFNANLSNGEYDRVYLAEHFAKYFANFIGNGVFGGNLSELMVSQAATPAMKVEIAQGMGWINGYWYENNGNILLNVDTADGVLDRIDSVVLRWSKVDRNIKAFIKKGTSAAEPLSPSLQRDDDVYELKLADISIKAGSTNIVQENISDKRFDTNVCGIVTGLIDQIDTKGFGEKLDSFFNELKSTSRDRIDGIVELLSTLVEDESALASLALKVDNIVSDVVLAKQSLGFEKKNMLPYPFDVGTTTTKGITFTDNGDGTFTANGTATENAYYVLYRGKPFGLGKYLVSSNVDTQAKHYTYIRFVDRQTSAEIPNTTQIGYESVPIEITQTDFDNYDLLVGFTVLRGNTVSNLIVRPMVRRAEIVDNLWEPYRLSVNEMLQEDNENQGCFYRPGRGTSSKEWVNPPLKFGVEYRIAERWNGKPVYQKAFYIASLPNKSTMSVEVNCAYDKVIHVEGFAIDSTEGQFYPFPIILDGFTPIAVISNVMEDSGTTSGIIIRTNADVSNMKAYITIKYTKS